MGLPVGDDPLNGRDLVRPLELQVLLMPGHEIGRVSGDGLVQPAVAEGPDPRDDQARPNPLDSGQFA